MKYQILNRNSSVVQFELECASLKECVVAAVNCSANLCGANLVNADLCGADLHCTNLRGADFRGADLRSTNLFDADLRGADLRGADLGAANLGDSNLRAANLGDANLCGADFRDAALGDADLRGAVLGGADLRGADLRGASLGEEKGTLVKDGYFYCGPQGSRNDYLQAFHTNNGIWVRAGCFFNTLEKFREEVVKNHGEESKYGKVYLSIVDLIELKFSEDITEEH